ncbi:MAG: hypothetical protein M3Z07_01560 [Candidatus Eremiobacteraeota bacterium]|nr:hypothetical protein [Candidatus Eremiobacteraeota bacterium]
MNHLRLAGALAAAIALLGTGTGFASNMHSKMHGKMMHGKMMHAKMSMQPGIVNKPSRFSGPGVYTGAPALGATLSLVVAGGGPSKFSTVTLLKDLTGSKFDAEVGSLTQKYGKDKIGSFITVFDFVVNDSLKIVTDKKIALPSTPNPDPKDGEALAGALWGAGQTGNGFNVEVMLDRAVSHGIHDQVMTDIDTKFGIAADANYHAVLNTAMHDLASVYHLNAMGKMGK